MTSNIPLASIRSEVVDIVRFPILEELQLIEY